MKMTRTTKATILKAIWKTTNCVHFRREYGEETKSLPSSEKSEA